MVAPVEGLGGGAPEGEGDLVLAHVHQRHLPLGQVLARLGGQLDRLARSLHHAHHVHVRVLRHAAEVGDLDEVVVDAGDVVSVVLAQVEGAVVLEGQFVVVVEFAVLLVGVLDGAVGDEVDLADHGLVEEGVALILEGRDPDLSRVVHHVHREELASAVRLGPGLHVRFAADPE